MSNITTQNRKTLFILAAILIIAAIVQAQNMFQFPYYHNDEGTHIANSWALINGGSLSPYTYSYEDPPLGSMIIALWTVATGGLSSFGFTINSGRVLMLILHVVATGLIYLNAKKLSKSDFVGAIATFVFAFSPLATSLQRMVVLENIMIVWLLAAMYLSIGEDRTLMHYFASALFFGLAVLTKGSAIFFFVALLYTVGVTAHQHHRRFARTMWIAIALFMMSFYPLYAQMKEELFPENWFLGGDFPHVSLLERLGDRGPETGRLLNYGSGLGASFEEWVDISNPIADPVLLYGGLIATVFVLLMAIDQRGFRPLLAMLLAEGLNLTFGGPIYNIDVIILLPFLAMSVGIVVGKIVEYIFKSSNGPVMQWAIVTGAMAILLYPFWSYNWNRMDVYTANEVEGQIEATRWVSENIPEDAMIVTDNFAFVELRETHPNVHSYWRVDTDPAVKLGLLHNDLCKIDYIVATPQIYSDIATFNMDLMKRTVESSEVLITYKNNGWPVEIRQVDKTHCAPELASDRPTN